VAASVFGDTLTLHVATQERPSPVRRRVDAATPVSDKIALDIVGGRGRLSWASLRELWHFREVQVAFVARQLKVRYKQAVIGAGWVILQPLIAAGIFALILGRYANVSTDAPFFLVALAGMVGWSYFANALAVGAESVVSNRELVRKIYFPREILPLTAVLSGLLDLVVALGVLVVATLAYGIWPALSWFALPLPMIILVLFAGACAVALSALNIYYRDVRYALPFVIQVGLLATPIAYSLAVIPAGYRTIYAILNPIAAAVEAIRRIVIYGEWPDAEVTFAALGWSFLLLALAAVLFKRLERGFADRA
jgi:lipopolysaccharide transport system permease protein